MEHRSITKALLAGAALILMARPARAQVNVGPKTTPGSIGPGVIGYTPANEAGDTFTGPVTFNVAPTFPAGIGGTNTNFYSGVVINPTSISSSLISPAATNVTLNGPVIQFFKFANNNALQFFRIDGTPAAPAALAANESIVNNPARGYDGSVLSGNAAQFGMFTQNAWTTSDHSTYIALGTTAAATTSYRNVLLVQADGATDPAVDNSFSLGETSLRWANLFTVNSTISGNETIAGTETIAGITQLGQLGVGGAPGAVQNYTYNNTAGRTGLQVASMAGNLFVDYQGGGYNYLDGLTDIFRTYSGTTYATLQSSGLTLTGGLTATTGTFSAGVSGTTGTFSGNVYGGSNYMNQPTANNEVDQFFQTASTTRFYFFNYGTAGQTFGLDYDTNAGGYNGEVFQVDRTAGYTNWKSTLETDGALVVWGAATFNTAPAFGNGAGWGSTFIPSVNNSYALGSSANQWSNVYSAAGTFGALAVNGVTTLASEMRAIRRVTAGATDTASSNDSYIMWASATTGAKTETLPACSATTGGLTMHIKDEQGNADTYAIVLKPASGTIEGASTYAISANRGAVEITCDGAATNWNLM